MVTSAPQYPAIPSGAISPEQSTDTHKFQTCRSGATAPELSTEANKSPTKRPIDFSPNAKRPIQAGNMKLFTLPPRELFYTQNSPHRKGVIPTNWFPSIAPATPTGDPCHDGGRGASFWNSPTNLPTERTGARPSPRNRPGDRPISTRTRPNVSHRKQANLPTDRRPAEGRQV